MENNNNNRKSIVPVISYFNLDTNKSIIYKENRGKSGIYHIYNIITGKSYIGSATDLSRRFSNNYSIKYLKYRSNNSRINRALLKYGYENFNLEILEYCNKENVISREQYYLDLLKPEYNILQIAGSSLGFKHSSYSKLIMSDLKIGERNSMFNKKHTKETRESISLTLKGRGRPGCIPTDITRAKISKAHVGKKHTQETKDKISLALKGRVYSEETRAKLSLCMLNKKPSIETRNKMKISHSKPILITNIVNNKICLYPSIKEAALKLNTTSTTIR
jgi:group I intron endonuclease